MDWLDQLLIEQTERENRYAQSPSHPGTRVPSLYDLRPSSKSGSADVDRADYLYGRYATPGIRLGIQGLPRAFRRHENGDRLAYYYDLH